MQFIIRKKYKIRRAGDVKYGSALGSFLRTIPETSPLIVGPPTINFHLTLYEEYCYSFLKNIEINAVIFASIIYSKLLIKFEKILRLSRKINTDLP